MKIGIISMQRVPNYGSFLQAYGLRHILESLGHEVEFIDYREEKPLIPYSAKERICYQIRELPVVKHFNDWFKCQVLGRKLFDYKYRLSYLKELGIGYKKNYSSAVDVAVIGSDEVFNCLQDGFNVGFSPMLFGQGINAKKVISYAASFGYTNYENLKKYGVDDRVQCYLKSFSAISVRDNNSCNIVMKLTGKEPEVNLDPVLISDFDIPETKIPYREYIILYTYKSREYSEKDKKMILDFCERNKKTLVSVGSVQDWVPNKSDATPFELLAYIKNADFVKCCVLSEIHAAALAFVYLIC